MRKMLRIFSQLTILRPSRSALYVLRFVFISVRLKRNFSSQVTKPIDQINFSFSQLEQSDGCGSDVKHL